MKSNVKCLMSNFELKNSSFKIHHLKLPRSGFTMVELIFVIIVIGILASIGTAIFPNNHLRNDTKYVIMKIKQTQQKAIGYSTYRFGDSEFWQENNTTCIDLTKNNIKNMAKNKESKPYSFLSDIQVNDNNSTICFDEYGRVYSQTEHKLLPDINITIKYNNKNSTISVYRYSGYVTLVK